MKEPPTNEQVLSTAMLMLDIQVRGIKALQHALDLAAAALAVSSPNHPDHDAREQHSAALDLVKSGAEHIDKMEPIPEWVLDKLADPNATLPTTRKAMMLEGVLCFLFLSHLLLMGAMWAGWVDVSGALSCLLALWVGSLAGLWLATRSWSPAGGRS